MDTKSIFLVFASLVCVAHSYRLSGAVVPISYALHLDIKDAAFTADNDTYTGEIHILSRTVVETQTIDLHASYDFMNLTSVSVATSGSTNFTRNSTTDILTITSDALIPANTTFDIHMTFVSRLSTGDMYGFYKSSYLENGTTKYLATTQFQPTYARRAFPCFDEPAYKATFEIWISHPKNLTALSNQPGEIQDVSDLINYDENQTYVKFNTTTKMSTYLIAFVVSEFTCSASEYVEGNNLIPHRICSRESTNDTRDFAVEIGPKLLQSLNRYTDFNYSAMGMEKMDQIAIPDFAAGAMENWGLVTYREALLLWDSEESTNTDQENIATIISHEFAHMWFGNLVTNQWWAELFLNEGFANYFQYFTTHDVLPDWELDKQYILQSVQRALDADALDTSHPLQHEVNSDAQVMSRFSVISYQKGGSILRMVEHILGSENFRKGLQAYLKQYAHNTTIPENLWDALDASLDNTNTEEVPQENTENETNEIPEAPQIPSRKLSTAIALPANLSTIMEHWVKHPGYPIIRVIHAEASIIIAQGGRFLLTGNDTTSRWYVPLAYTLSTDNPSQFLNTTPRAWMERVGVVELDAAPWVILNNQASGFYRVLYDDTLWDRIGTALNATNFTGVPDLTRSQLVDDAFAFARTGLKRYPAVFNFIDFLRHDDSIYPWTPALTGFHTVLRRVGYDSRLGNAIKTHVLDLIQNISASVPFRTLNESNHAYTMKQTAILTAACRMGQEACVNQALERFGEFRLDSTIRPPKNLRSIIYCNALRYNTENVAEDWYLLLDLYNTTELAAEKVRILNALGCTRDEGLLRYYLDLSLEPNTGIRPQDAINVFTSVYASNDVGVDVAFEFLRENHEVIAERYQSMNALPNMIRGLAERFTTEHQVEDLRWFVQATNLTDEFKTAAQQALTTAESNMAWISQHRGELYEYYEMLEEEEPDTNSTTPPANGTTPTPPPEPSGTISLGVPNLAAMFILFVVVKLSFVF